MEKLENKIGSLRSWFKFGLSAILLVLHSFEYLTDFRFNVRLTDQLNRHSALIFTLTSPSPAILLLRTVDTSEIISTSILSSFNFRHFSIP